MLGARRSLRLKSLNRHGLGIPSASLRASILPAIPRLAAAAAVDNGSGAKRHASFPGGQFPGMRFPGQQQPAEKGATLKQYVSLRRSQLES